MPNSLAPVDKILSKSKSSNNAQLPGSRATIIYKIEFFQMNGIKNSRTIT
jgi:hypothetical protein